MGYPCLPTATLRVLFSLSGQGLTYMGSLYQKTTSTSGSDKRPTLRLKARGKDSSPGRQWSARGASYLRWLSEHGWRTAGISAVQPCAAGCDSRCWELTHYLVGKKESPFSIHRARRIVEESSLSLQYSIRGFWCRRDLELKTLGREIPIRTADRQWVKESQPPFLSPSFY